MAPARLTLALLAALAPLPAGAERVRVAAWGADLSREGPGLLLRDLLSGEDAGVEAVLALLLEARPDVLLLTDLDWDAEGAALGALAARLEEAGLPYPARLALPSNAGLASGLDLDGDGRLGGPGDAQGWGRFRGGGAMALLSRLPLGEPRDFSALLWRDLPGARLPQAEARPFPSEAAQAAQRLSSTGHWVVPLLAPGGEVALMAWAATPPVFDGAEDRNGRRNADELALWSRLLDGAWGEPPGRFVLVGDAQLDPADGEGFSGDMAAFLADPRLRDPRPASEGARQAAEPAQAGNPAQAGDPALDTVDWPEGRPGNLRTTYALPSANLAVLGAGVLWPPPGDPLAPLAEAAGPHRLVWVDLDL